MPFIHNASGRFEVPFGQQAYANERMQPCMFGLLQCRPPPYLTDKHGYSSGVEYKQVFQHWTWMEPLYTEFEKTWWPYCISPNMGLNRGTLEMFADNWYLPITLCVAYLILCFGGRLYLHDRKPYDLRNYLLAWNLFLAIFSFCGAVRTVPHLLFNLQVHGLEYTICHPPDIGYGNGAVGLWTVLFILSKPAELFDTAFIVLRKKPLIFLHWYHHVTVLLYCWHAYATQTPNALWFVAMNYSVHAAMYLYYAAMIPFRKQIPPGLNVCITLFQTSQMFVGVAVQVWTYQYKQLGQASGDCPVDGMNQMYGILMYASYLLLFLHILFTKVIALPAIWTSSVKTGDDQNEAGSKGKAVVAAKQRKASTKPAAQNVAPPAVSPPALRSRKTRSSTPRKSK